MKKSPITLLVFATICGSLQADVSVSGAHNALSYTSRSGTSSGWLMDESISFAGSGALDNGWSVSLSYLTMDNPNTTADNITTGQISLSGSFGALSVGGADDPTSVGIDNPTPDDMTPTAYGETSAWTVSASHSQYNTGLSDENKVQASFVYHLPSMDGVSLGFSTSYADQFFNSGSTKAVATGARYVFDTGIPGMTGGFSATVGHVDTDHGSTNDVVNQNSWKYTTAGAAIAYAVNDNLSISYGVAHNGSSIDSAKDDESMGISAAYTYGGMTIKAYMSDKTYNNGVQESDGSTSMITIGLAF